MISYLSVSKPNFLNSHMDSFLKAWEPSPTNMAKFSIRTVLMEKRYIGKWSTNIFADCYWRHKGDITWRINEAKEGEVINGEFFVVRLP